MNEFDVIARYFAPLGRDGFTNDAAVLSVPDGQELVVTSDTLNAGTHFFADAAAGDIARKALRVNVSDLAAMGADPYCYQLNIAFPDAPAEEWLAEFTEALAADQAAFGLFCSGGDTTSIQEMSYGVRFTKYYPIISQEAMIFSSVKDEVKSKAQISSAGDSVESGWLCRARIEGIGPLVLFSLCVFI